MMWGSESSQPDTCMVGIWIGGLPTARSCVSIVATAGCAALRHLFDVLSIVLHADVADLLLDLGCKA